MAEFVRCDQCDAEASQYEVDISWFVLRVPIKQRGRGARANADLCSWECVREFDVLKVMRVMARYGNENA